MSEAEAIQWRSTFRKPAPRDSSATGYATMARSTAGGPDSIPPNLYENRDLAVTTEFRDVFAEILSKRMCVKKPDRVFPAYAV